MRRPIPAASFPALLGVLLCTCSPARESGEETLGVMRPDATFPTERSGIVEPLRDVIRTPEGWRAFWERRAPTV